ncbi:MAG TPA: low temperature requirement protein A [Acidimicrobiales bacterium]|nr:low temperature requirement protein A [Acidimicrobiales bacterium]
MEETQAQREERVASSTLELFFDLVFVFGFTQITGVVTHDETAVGLLHGVLVFGVLWWAWGAYAWLTNAVPVDETLPRLVVLAATAAMLVTALAVPTAWQDGGHEGGVAFALGYLVVMLLHTLLFVVAGENPETTRRAILRLAPTNIAAALLLVVAGAADGGAQLTLWVAALAVTYAGPYLTGVTGFTVHPTHLVERHGLIVIVALGESVVAIGAGGDIDVDGGLAGVALAAMVVIVGLWWAYFDHDAAASEEALVAATGPERARMARDVYSYLHIPLVLGIVLSAVGIHDALVHPGEPLDALVAGALAGGVALFLAGLLAIRLRAGRLRPTPAAWTALAVALVMTVAGAHVDAAVAVGVLAVTVASLAIAERQRPPVVESTA